MSATVEEHRNKSKEARSRWDARSVNAGRDIWTIEVRICPLIAPGQQLFATHSFLFLSALFLLFGGRIIFRLRKTSIHLARIRTLMCLPYILHTVVFLASHRLARSSSLNPINPIPSLLHLGSLKEIGALTYHLHDLIAPPCIIYQANPALPIIYRLSAKCTIPAHRCRLMRGLTAIYLSSYITSTTSLCSPCGLKVFLRSSNHLSFPILPCNGLQNLLVFHDRLHLFHAIWAAIIITFAFGV